jgi:hypothetical protein
MPDDRSLDLTPTRLVVVLTLVLQAWLVVAAVLLALRGDWSNTFLTLTVVALTVVPAFVMRQHRVHVPAEFQFLATAFAFLTLFLGSVRDFYYRFWWWDMVLHLGSGFLLGVVGWIALFVLNNTDRLPRGIRPAFQCVFAVSFAVTLGVLWEIFEYAVDSLWPHVNMMSLETGVADTMNDLIVNLVGALVVGAMGWAHARTGRYSFLVDGVRSVIRSNPRWFRRRKRGA